MRRFRSTAVAALLCTATLAPAAQPGAAPPAERPEEDFLLLALYLRQHRLADAIPAWAAGDDVLLPLGELSRTLRLDVEVDLLSGTAHGVLGPGGIELSLDVPAGRVSVAGRWLDLPAGLVEVHRSDIFVASSLLARWLPLDLLVDRQAATLVVTPREALPFELEQERRQRGARLSMEGTSPTLPRHPAPHRLAALPGADVEVRLDTGGGGSPLGQVTAYATGDLLFMDGALFIAGGSEDPLSDLRLSLARRDPDGHLLGPLAAREVVLGESLFPGVDLIARTASGPGFLLTNHPLERAEGLGRQSFRGALPPGWQVELYRDRELLALDGGRSGFYHFPDVPLRYGLNLFRLVFYGPRGERREEERLIHVGDDDIPAGSLRYRLAGQEPRATSRRAVIELDYGLSRAVSAGIAVSQVDVDGSRQEYGKATLRGSWNRALGAIDWAVGADGGSAVQASLLTRWRTIGVLVQHAELSEFRSDAFLDSHGTVSRRTLLRLDGSLLGIRRLPLALEVRRDELAQGGSLSELRGRLSTSHRGWFVTHELAWRQPEGLEGFEASGRGTLVVSRFGLRYALRGDLSYMAAPDWALESVAFELERHLTRDYQLFASVRQALGSDETRLRAGLRRVHGTFGWSVGLDASDRGDLRATASLNVGLAPDVVGSGWETAARPLAAMGAVAARVFLDIDGDGRPGEDEPPLQGIGFVVGGLPHPARTGPSGAALLLRLPAHRPTTLQVAPHTLEDPLWVPASPGVEVVPRPGTTIPVALAVIGTGEVTGTLRIRAGEQTWEGAGWRVQLVDATGQVVAEEVTAYDGFFDLQAIPPGRYVLRPAAPPGWVIRQMPEVALSVAPTGALLDGRDLLVEVEPPSDPPAAVREAADPPLLAIVGETHSASQPPTKAQQAFAVQVASCRNRAFAADYARRLEEELGLRVRVVPVHLGERGRWFRVLVGEMEDRSTADQLRRELLARPPIEVGPIREVQRL